MSALAISGIVFVCICGGTLLGMVMRAVLPEQHLSPESKDVVKLGMGLIGTMTALVLGLLIASAKSSFDAQRNGLSQLAANIIMMDRALAHYGPESKGVTKCSAAPLPTCFGGPGLERIPGLGRMAIRGLKGDTKRSTRRFRNWREK